MRRDFSARLPVAAIGQIAHSVGAHLAAKLQEFENDERTLTDELCDMLCAWCAAITSPQVLSIPLTLTKITPPVEAKIGADLEFIVITPFGEKRCLLQAKVIDPNTAALRGNTPRDIERLRKQLRDLRRAEPQLPFLLLYVPGADLDGRSYGISTWEQQYSVASPTRPGSRFGATFIHVDGLLNGRNSWRRKPPLDYANGVCNPGGMSLGDLLLKLLSCELGTWQAPGTSHNQDVSERTATPRVPYRTLAVNATDVRSEVWPDVIGVLRGTLNDLEGPGSDLSAS
jgi:hypothetical protein